MWQLSRRGKQWLGVCDLLVRWTRGGVWAIIMRWLRFCTIYRSVYFSQLTSHTHKPLAWGSDVQQQDAKKQDVEAG